MTRTYIRDAVSGELHSDDCEGNANQGGGGCARHCPQTAEMVGFPVRCDLLGCCDAPGAYHFHDLGQLRDWLASPFREEDIPIDVSMFGRCGAAWDNAREASEWLDIYDREMEREIEREWILEHSGRPGRI